MLQQAFEIKRNVILYVNLHNLIIYSISQANKNT